MKNVISDEHMDTLRNACDYLIDVIHHEMDRFDPDQIHIIQRNKRSILFRF